jgi:hypothetical protein
MPVLPKINSFIMDASARLHPMVPARLVLLKFNSFIMDASASVGSGVRWRYKFHATDTLQCECRIKKEERHFLVSSGLCMVRGPWHTLLIIQVFNLPEP